MFLASIATWWPLGIALVVKVGCCDCQNNCFVHLAVSFTNRSAMVCLINGENNLFNGEMQCRRSLCRNRSCCGGPLPQPPITASHKKRHSGSSEASLPHADTLQPDACAINQGTALAILTGCADALPGDVVGQPVARAAADRTGARGTWGAQNALSHAACGRGSAETAKPGQR